MNTIKEKTIFEQVIKKSRFICYLFPVSTVDEADAYLNEIRKTHYDATHNCYGYIIGDNGSIAKSSDDGEPSQTAGVVIYEVLKKNDLTNVLAIVTRYFGGIKLGAGGLIRSYGSSVSGALKISEIEKIIKCKKLVLTFDYPYLNSVIKLLDGCEVISKVFTDEIVVEVLVPENNTNDLSEDLVNNTLNNIKIETF